ncbi:hypothetical protein PNOK_0563200 [Pyrrhoderma noxium]|uniref:F-box domain-containing protein n=1 Tax=Pyrrhoderma noxium TaxID=2282107 RepID=A0A286UGZ1_9AGAM|nr:hypothetical protein PNOK_0563200 [Pyrrhoderma noxium]
MSKSAADRNSPGVWEKIIYHIIRRELSSLTGTSKLFRGYVPPLPYRDLEISLTKCSNPNYNLLFRTISKNQELGNLIKSITIDLNPRLEGDLPFFPEIGPLTALSHLNNVKEINVKEIKFFAGNTMGTIGNLMCNPFPWKSLLNTGNRCIENVFKSPAQSTLRILDLAYVGVDDRQLCTFISQNSDSLEAINLQYVVETSQSPLFEKYDGSRLKRLESFSIAGPQNVSSIGVLQMFGRGQSLKQLKLESLTKLSVFFWTLVLADLAIPTADCAKGMDVVSFGAVTGYIPFWDSVVAFLRGRCGPKIKELHINGLVEKSKDEPHPGLFEYLREAPQINLISLTLNWGDGSKHDLKEICQLYTSVETLHLTTPFLPPIDSAVKFLREFISPFKKLKELHLTLVKTRDGNYSGLKHGISHADVDTVAVHSEDERNIPNMFFIQSSQNHRHLEKVIWDVVSRSDLVVREVIKSQIMNFLQSC